MAAVDLAKGAFAIKRGWVLRVLAAVFWLAVCVLGVFTHGSPISIAAGACLALIFAYRAYTATHSRADTPPAPGAQSSQ